MRVVWVAWSVWFQTFYFDENRNFWQIFGKYLCWLCLASTSYFKNQYFWGTAIFAGLESSTRMRLWFTHFILIARPVSPFYGREVIENVMVHVERALIFGGSKESAFEKWRFNCGFEGACRVHLGLYVFEFWFWISPLPTGHVLASSRPETKYFRFSLILKNASLRCEVPKKLKIRSFSG